MRLPPVFALLLVLIGAPVAAQPRPALAAIASAHPLATAAGREIIEAGGNAFDAGVAVAAALAVVEPYASGMGGGGFFLLHRARDGRDVMIDARERAPNAARADMYLDPQGVPVPSLSLNGPLAAAIPGFPAGLVHLARSYGNLPLSRSFAPAIRLARDGFAVTPRYRRMAELRREVLLKWGGGSVFLDRERVPSDGFRVRQADLARTLERLGREGTAGFYDGETAQRLVQSVRAAGGIWTTADLKQYRVIEREPLVGTYRGARVVTAALPSAGGVLLLEMLGMLEGFEVEKMAPAERAHVLVEVMRRGYRDRAFYLGDPDFVPRDLITRLLDRRRVAELRSGIDRQRATPSNALAASIPQPRERPANTTHFSIIDTAGNRVAATLSINTLFGSGFIAPGTGVLLNNEMDDFVAAPDTPNTYSLMGGAANAIAPGKRPLSSMTPTFVETREGIAILGAPGGSRITSMVLLAALDFIHGVGDVAAWVARPRFHHQYLPDRVDYEPQAFTTEEAELLRRRGHTLRLSSRPYGNMQAIVWDRAKNRVEAAADPRGEGGAAVFAVEWKRPARAGAGR